MCEGFGDGGKCLGRIQAFASHSILWDAVACLRLWCFLLACNVVSHWLGTYTKWSLMRTCIIYSVICHWHDSSCIKHCTTGTQQMLSCNCFKAPFTGWKVTHWGRERMAAISQMTLSNAFSWMKIYEFWLKFHWSLFVRVQLTIFQHWFRQWLGADQVTRHYLNQWWLDYRRIYASLGLNELSVVLCTNYISIKDFHIVTNLL